MSSLASRWHELKPLGKFGVALDGLSLLLIIVFYVFSGFLFPILGEVNVLGSRDLTNFTAGFAIFFSIFLPFLALFMKDNPIRWQVFFFILAQYAISHVYIFIQFSDLSHGGSSFVSAGS